MSQYQPYAPTPQPQPAAPKKAKRWPWIVGIVVAFLAGVGAGQAGGATGTTAAPAPTVTVTAEPEAAPVEDEAPVVEEEGAPPPPAYDPKPSDFKVGVKITDKKCFGSAGCNVVFRIDPEYVGTESVDPTKTYEIVYEVKGVEDGPLIGSFTLSDGEASFDSAEVAQIKSSGVKLTAKVTEVLPG